MHLRLATIAFDRVHILKVYRSPDPELNYRSWEGGGTATQTAAQVSHPQQNDKKAGYFLTILGYAGPFWHRADHATGLTRFVSCSTCPTQEKEGDGRGEGLGEKTICDDGCGHRKGHPDRAQNLPAPPRAPPEPGGQTLATFPELQPGSHVLLHGGGHPGTERADRQTDISPRPFPHGAVPHGRFPHALPSWWAQAAVKSLGGGCAAEAGPGI